MTYKESKLWDRLANHYAKKAVPNAAAYEQKLNVTRQYLHPDMRVLEIGCGTGTTALKHAPYVSQIDAFDFSAKMIDIANQKAAKQHISNVNFQQKSIEDLDLEAGSYDVVMAHSILHLLRDKQDAIRKVHKALKSNGIFVTNTACIGDTKSFFKVIGPIGHFLGILPLLDIFTKAELEHAFVQAGFDIDYKWQPEGSDSLFVIAKKSRD